MGLALYICRRIVEAHGGRIWAENAARGGSVFHLELPVGFGSVDEGKAPGSLPDQAADRMRERALAAGASVRGADS
jgi:hypothetical protein